MTASSGVTFCGPAMSSSLKRSCSTTLPWHGFLLLPLAQLENIPGQGDFIFQAANSQDEHEARRSRRSGRKEALQGPFQGA